MDRRLRTLIGAGLVTLAAPVLTAQTVVGHTPSNSPFRDVTPSQRLTLFGGYFRAQQDEIGATPRSAPIFGLRYGVPVGGPAEFHARLARTSSQRTAFDPTLGSGSRSLGTVNSPLLLGDIGFDLNATGERTWHDLMPFLGLGVGVAHADRGNTRDPYTFGTQFAIQSELGVRILPGDRYSLRLTVGNTLYQNHYPAQYYVTPAGSTSALLGTNTPRSGYRSNWSYTAGLEIPIFR